MSAPQQLAQLGLPPIDQVAFVVRDLDSWTRRHEALFGPFHYMDGSVPASQYRGRESDVELKLAFGRSGDLEIEYIEWVSGDSPHREFLEAGGEGLHHVRYRVEDLQAWLPRFEELGFEPIWFKQFSSDTAFVYLEHVGDSLIVELLQMPEGGPGE